ncbi:MAG: hypothetical protein JWR22_1007 [Herminiimonas sp.]|nr:hypothetical protein [Herminiimonas sp.]
MQSEMIDYSMGTGTEKNDCIAAILRCLPLFRKVSHQITRQLRCILTYILQTDYRMFPRWL